MRMEMAMAVLLTVLKVLGIILLVLLAVLLLLVLIILFVPFRYSFSGGIRDPEGSEKLLHLQLKRDASLEAEVRWLAGAVHARALAGSASPEGGCSLELKLFGFKIPLERLLHRKKDGEKEKEEEKPPETKEKRSLDERIEEILNKVERVHRRLEDMVNALGTSYGIRARQVLAQRLLDLLETVLPQRWALSGVLGLGDPARSAGVFAVQGFLYPVTAGHVSVGVEYDLFRYDLQAAAQGGIRIAPFVYAGLRIILNRDVRRLIKRLRRGPSGQNGHRVFPQETGTV